MLRMNGAVKRAACDGAKLLLLSLGTPLKGGQLGVYSKIQPNIFESSPFARRFMVPPEFSDENQLSLKNKCNFD